MRPPRTVVIAVLTLLLAACSKKDPAPTAPPATSAPAESVAPALDLTPPAVPRVKHFTTSIAHFTKGVLVECADVAMDVTPPYDAGNDWKPSADPLEALSKGLGKDVTRSVKACAEQFSDRTALATCRTSESSTNDAGVGMSTVTRASFYDYAEIGLKDDRMASCTKEKGIWKAISRDSPEWQKAKLEHAPK